MVSNIRKYQFESNNFQTGIKQCLVPILISVLCPFYGKLNTNTNLYGIELAGNHEADIDARQKRFQLPNVVYKSVFDNKDFMLEISYLSEIIWDYLNTDPDFAILLKLVILFSVQFMLSLSNKIQ